MWLRSIGAVAGISAMAVGLGASPALASPGHGVTAVTHTHHHADTSANSGGCTVASDGGPVWAYDNLSFRFEVVSTGTSTYTVTITASGSYDAFASRFTGTCTSQHGSVSGWVNYTVRSTAGPDSAALPPQQPHTVSQTTMLEELFQTGATITGSGGYRYTYELTGMKCVTSTTGFHCS